MIRFEDYRAICLSNKGAEESFPFGPQAAWYKVGGKAFSWTFVKEFKMDNKIYPPFTFINLKFDPIQADIWRKEFENVVPGWHQNKKHWNTVFMNSAKTDDLITMINHAYDIVYQSLSIKMKNKIQHDRS